MSRSKWMPLLLFGVAVFFPEITKGDDAHGAEAMDTTPGSFWDRIKAGGLIEFGGGYKSSGSAGANNNGQTDFHLAAVEIGIGISINTWLRADTVLLREDPFGGEEISLGLDAGFVTFKNSKKLPLYLSVGKLYVPFGSLLTHFPDAPAADQPVTLLMGQTSEKAVVIGAEHSGLSVSAYVFDSAVKEAGHTAGVSFGLDGRYQSPEDGPTDLLLGASYISSIADSDGLTDAIRSNVEAVENCVGGISAYFHIGFQKFFFDGEYMTALDAFRRAELPMANDRGARPSVWNIETGYNWNWGRTLEMVLKYAGSNETEALGLPRKQFGFGLNQQIARTITASFAFLRDRYHAADIKGRDKGHTVLGQIAVNF